MATSRDPAARNLWIKKCAQLILSSYRRDDFADPDGYTLQLAMILDRYDDAVIEAVTLPTTGIQRTCKFPPSIAEVVAFIDDHIRRANYAKEYDTRTREQLREREEFERSTKAETPEHRAAVVKRCKEEARAKGFRFPEDKTPHHETPASVRARFDISKEQWDAIANSPLPDAWQTLNTAAGGMLPNEPLPGTDEHVRWQTEQASHKAGNGKPFPKASPQLEAILRGRRQ